MGRPTTLPISSLATLSGPSGTSHSPFTESPVGDPIGFLATLSKPNGTSRILL
jgi:hypothetical protein